MVVAGSAWLLATIATTAPATGRMTPWMAFHTWSMKGILSATKSRSARMTSAAMNQVWVTKAKCGFSLYMCNQRTESAKASIGRYAFKPEANARPKGVPNATISIKIVAGTPRLQAGEECDLSFLSSIAKCRHILVYFAYGQNGED